jgi:hypothetical protein
MRRHVGTLAFCFAAFLVALAPTASSEGQTNSQALGAGGAYHPIDQGSYEESLGLAFPPMPAMTKGTVFAMRIRYRPAFDPESQVLVVLTQNATAAVDYAVAGEQIYAKANAMMRNGGPGDPAAIARGISVRHDRREMGSARALEWQRGMIQSLTATLLSWPRETGELYRRSTRQVFLDGTTYDLSYSQGGTSFTWRFEETADGSAFAKWADALRAELVKRRSN